MCKLLKNEEVKTIYFNEDDKSVTKSIDRMASDVVKYMSENDVTLTAAESCTGGLFSTVITSVSGASNVFKGSSVVYTEEMKMKMLGVSKSTLDKYSVYSPECASEMCIGARKLADADYAVAITGIAGPNGGTNEKPVGTVYVSVMGGSKTVTKNLRLNNEMEYGRLDREGIRTMTVFRALEMLLGLLDETLRKEDK